MIINTSAGGVLIDGTGRDVPAILARFGRHQPVAGYIDGPLSAWTPMQFAEFSSKMKLTTGGNPAAAKYARAQDIETGDASDSDFPLFLLERQRLGFDDATGYRDLSGIGSLLAAIRSAGLDAPSVPWRIWAAWYWGRPVPPTRAQVLDRLATAYGVTLAPGRLWACQWFPTADWDVSVVYGEQDWTH